MGDLNVHDDRPSSNPSTDQGAPSDHEDPNKVDSEKENTVAPRPDDPASFPDGGTRAWLVVAGAFACLFSSFGWVCFDHTIAVCLFR